MCVQDGEVEADGSHEEELPGHLDRHAVGEQRSRALRPLDPLGLDQPGLVTRDDARHLAVWADDEDGGAVPAFEHDGRP